MHSTVGNAQLILLEDGLEPVAHLLPTAIWNVHGLVMDGWVW